MVFRTSIRNLRLKEDLLEVWRSADPSLQAAITPVIQAFQTRHWLAHGRYWTFKQGYPLDLVLAKRIVDRLVNRLSASSFGFFPLPLP